MWNLSTPGLEAPWIPAACFYLQGISRDLPQEGTPLLMKPLPSGSFSLLPPSQRLLGIPHFLIRTTEPQGGFPQPRNVGHFPAFPITFSPSAYQPPTHTNGGCWGEGRLLEATAPVPGADTLSTSPQTQGTSPLCPVLKGGDSVTDGTTVEHTASKSRMGPTAQRGEEISAGASQHSPSLFPVSHPSPAPRVPALPLLARSVPSLRLATCKKE